MIDIIGDISETFDISYDIDRGWILESIERIPAHA